MKASGTHDQDCVLTINAGSSSLKFALFRSATLARVLVGKFERIALSDSKLRVTNLDRGDEEQLGVEAPNHAACVPALLRVIEQAGAVAAIGHRLVHGGAHHREPQRVTPEMLAELRRLSPFAPEHMPAEIALVDEFARRHPDVTQVACFDTAFHRDLPRVSKLLPIPRRYEALGVRRYGFHGLSYAFLMQELNRVAGADTARGRIIIAHLGNGASMAAVRDGKCIDTTMAFTPAAGLVMSTRSGDLDPGLAAYLARAEGMTAEQFDEMVNAKSGLLGVSEISSDVRDLLQQEAGDVRAAEALALFCYQARKWIGALAAALGGLDTLVFSGGIGENSPVMRERICDGLEFLGLQLDGARNEASAPIITMDGSRVTARVVRTDEELYIAQVTSELVSQEAKTNPSSRRSQS